MPAMAAVGLGRSREPGAENSIQLSHVGGKDSTTGAITCYLPGCVLAENESQEPELATEPKHSDMGHKSLKC